jgi:hypothetical protein
VFFPVAKLTNIAVFILHILDDSFSVEKPFKEGSFVSCTIGPLESACALFLPQVVLTSIDTLVILFDSFALWVLVTPSSTVVKTGHFVSIGAFSGVGAHEVAGIRKNVNRAFEFSLVRRVEITFEIALKLSVLLELIDLHIACGQLLRE